MHHSNNIKLNPRGTSQDLNMRLLASNPCSFDLNKPMEWHIQTSSSVPVFQKPLFCQFFGQLFRFVVSNQLQNPGCAKTKRPTLLHSCVYGLIGRLEGLLLSITSLQAFATTQLFRNFIFSVSTAQNGPCSCSSSDAASRQIPLLQSQSQPQRIHPYFGHCLD